MNSLFIQKQIPTVFFKKIYLLTVVFRWIYSSWYWNIFV